MIAECAVEPEVMAEWRHFQSLHGDFGIGQGRLLCQFPSKWRKEVLQAVQRLEQEGRNSPMQSQRIVDQFQHGAFRRGLVQSFRDFPAEGSWIEAARKQTTPFDVIIHSGAPASAIELHAGEFLKTDAPYARTRQREVRRIAAELIEVGWPGFRRAKEIFLIDPYFSPSVAKFGEVLGSFLARLERESSTPRRLEVHTALPDPYHPDIQMRNWERWAQSHLPSGWKLKVSHWATLETGGRMHARYILTDIGGLDYNWGTDEDPNEYTQVGLLDDPFWEQLYSRFAGEPGSPPRALQNFPDRSFEITG